MGMGSSELVTKLGKELLFGARIEREELLGASSWGGTLGPTSA